jgi:hypothetical protein
MNGTENLTALLVELDDLGISARVVAGDLRLRPKEKVTPELAARLGRHKTEIVRLLALDQDQREAWLERVAICTVDGNLSEEAAEAVAWAQIEAGK